MTIKQLIEKLSAYPNQDQELFSYNIETDQVEPIIGLQIDEDGEIIVS